MKLLRSYLNSRKDTSPFLFISTIAGLPTEKQLFHALKHSIGTHILDAGEDIDFAKDWLGHKNIQNTTIYSRYSTGTRDTRARKMFFSSNRVVAISNKGLNAGLGRRATTDFSSTVST